MCLLCVRMPDAPINIEYLRNANDNNPDGSGFAILRSNLSGIDTFCSMDGDETIARYIEAVERDPECWSMYHARYATHGTSTVDNVHPFFVGGSKKTVLAHNGILPVDVPHGSKRSDTRIFAENILPSMGLGILDYKHGFEALENWCAGSKVALFSIDPRLDNNVYIINEDAGHWNGGTWWSNSGYSYSWRRSFSINHRKYEFSYDPVHGIEAYKADNDKDFERIWREGVCPLCDNAMSDRAIEMDVCDSCFACLDCYEDSESDCMCHVPERKRSLASELPF